MSYVSRIADGELRAQLAASGAVLVEGAKACGKTETARQIAASEVLLDVESDAREAAALDPRLILPGDVPRLIDEWQLAPEIWNHVRRAVDDRVDPGQFILAGSAQPTDATPGTPAQDESAAFACVPCRCMRSARATVIFRSQRC